LLTDAVRDGRLTLALAKVQQASASATVSTSTLEVAKIQVLSMLASACDSGELHTILRTLPGCEQEAAADITLSNSALEVAKIQVLSMLAAACDNGELHTILRTGLDLDQEAREAENSALAEPGIEQEVVAPIQAVSEKTAMSLDPFETRTDALADVEIKMGDVENKTDALGDQAKARQDRDFLAMMAHSLSDKQFSQSTMELMDESDAGSLFATFHRPAPHRTRSSPPSFCHRRLTDVPQTRLRRHSWCAGQVACLDDSIFMDDIGLVGELASGGTRARCYLFKTGAQTEAGNQVKGQRQGRSRPFKDCETQTDGPSGFRQEQEVHELRLQWSLLRERCRALEHQLRRARGSGRRL
jgi:hypothetical protein